MGARPILSGGQQFLPLPKKLPVDEVLAILDMPSQKTVLGRRDDAILELLYGGGLRISHLGRSILLVWEYEGRDALVR